MGSIGLFNQSLFNTAEFNAGISGGTPSIIAASDIIYTSSRICGILESVGGGNSQGELTDGFNTLNTMIDSWKVERAMIYAQVRVLFDTIAGKNVYSIGLDGSPDFPVERPIRIDNAGFVWTNVTPNPETPARVLTDQEWKALSPKDLTSTIWALVYYEATVPNGTIHLFPKPTSNWQIALYPWQSVPRFVSITDPVVVPPGYLEAMEYNLAVRLAHRFPNRAKMSADAMQMARELLAKVKNANTPVLTMKVDSAIQGPGHGGRWSIISNSYIP